LGTETARVLLCWRRFGPYHLARFDAVSRRFELIGLQIAKIDQDHPVDHGGLFGRSIISLQDERQADQLRTHEIEELTAQALKTIQPQVVVIHGYGTRDALVMLQSAINLGIAAIVMSDSNFGDKKRMLAVEAIKRRLISLFSSALVAGQNSSHYIVNLGMPKNRVFIGYNVVDNRHFSSEPEAGTLRSGIAPRQPFFLSVGRFVGSGPDAGVKNFHRLLQAYAVYKEKAIGSPWQIALVGDGELRPAVENEIGRLGLEQNVSIPGSANYYEMRAWYRAASALVLPSTKETWGLVVNEAMAAGLPVLVSNRCGCAPDLVRDGINGFIFDPYDVQGMADVMFRVAHGNVDCEAMGRASQEIIADWSPERFADGLAQAVEAALSAQPARPTLLDRALLWALIHR
jgi:1,2-diacylglycerol 3-alpha-glucosyltransferase